MSSRGFYLQCPAVETEKAGTSGQTAPGQSPVTPPEAPGSGQVPTTRRLPWPPHRIGGLEAPEWLGMPRGDYPPEEAK